MEESNECHPHQFSAHKRLVPGQKMGYRVTEAKDRADLIAYLRKISPP